jgi:aspartyl-tRNA synthetase
LIAALAATGAEPGDLVLMVADERRTAEWSLGRVRTILGERMSLGDARALRFLWVSDFPLFDPAEREGGAAGDIVPSHHPFTAPHPEDEEKLLRGEDLRSVRSRAYDVVLNGVELGSGSIRIHRPEVQARVFDILGIGREEAQRRFGFLLEALRYGTPPHGGIAPGFDRIVMLLVGGSSLREVIAFPKTTQANALMEGAPAEVDSRELRDLHIAVDPSPRG